MNGGLLKGKDQTLKGFERAFNEVWKGSFTFIVAADTQLGMISNFDSKTKSTYSDKYPDQINWDREIELCKESVSIANKLSPEFFIICGDLLDAFPDRYPDVRRRQEIDFLKIYSELKCPLICVCGNHDVGNVPTTQTLSSYNNSFGDDYFSFWKNGIHFIVLNSQFYENDKYVQEYSAKQEEWLEQQLKSGHRIIVFQHIPWFLQNFNEPKNYFNIEPILREKMLDRFHSAGVEIIFCGHYHRNAGGFYKNMEIVVSSAIGCQIGDDNHGMRIVRVNEKSVSHEYKEINNFNFNT